MKIETQVGNVEVVNEPTYTFGSEDNVRKYHAELSLAREGHICSTHGLLINGEPKLIIGAGGGASGIHAHTVVVVDDRAYIAIGDSVVCLSLDPVKVIWATQVDPATCFGVYYERERSALLSHGELEIVRFSEDGEIMWAVSGADIFSEGFCLDRDAVRATDFNGSMYRFDYDTGRQVA